MTRDVAEFGVGALDEAPLRVAEARFLGEVAAAKTARYARGGKRLCSAHTPAVANVGLQVDRDGGALKALGHFEGDGERRLVLAGAATGKGKARGRRSAAHEVHADGLAVRRYELDGGHGEVGGHGRGVVAREQAYLAVEFLVLDAYGDARSARGADGVQTFGEALERFDGGEGGEEGDGGLSAGVGVARADGFGGGENGFETRWRIGLRSAWGAQVAQRLDGGALGLGRLNACLGKGRGKGRKVASGARERGGGCGVETRRCSAALVAGGRCGTFERLVNRRERAVRQRARDAAEGAGKRGA